MATDPANGQNLEAMLDNSLTNWVVDGRMQRGSFNSKDFTPTAVLSEGGWKFFADGSYYLNGAWIPLFSRTVATTNFDAVAGYPSSTNGSGSITASTGLFLQTGTTLDSYAQLSWNIVNSTNFKIFSKDAVLSMVVNTDTVPTSNNPSVFLGMGEVTIAGSGHTFTDNHIGWKIVRVSGSTNLYATQANGTTETASSALLTGLVANDVLELVIIYDAGVSATYYYTKNAGTAASVTLTATMPATSTATGVIGFSATNSSTTSPNSVRIGAVSFVR